MTEPTDQTQQARPRTLLAGMNASSPLLASLTNDPSSDVTRLTGVPAMAVLTTDAVDLEFTGQRSIPQLRIRGRLESVVATDPDSLPYSLTQVSLPAHESVDVEAVYRFTTEQIETLVRKGLYLDGFGPSDTWIGLAMELPVEADIVLIAPQRTGEPPVVGVEVNKMSAIDTSLEHSRYQFADAFEDYRGRLIEDGILAENDIPGEGLEAELSEDGFDFVESEHTTGPVVEIIDPAKDVEGARLQMEELIGQRLSMGDQMELLRAEERERSASGVGAKAREGLVRREDQASQEAFNAGMRERVIAFGGKLPQTESSQLDDDALLAALGGSDAELELDDVEFDFPEEDSVQDQDQAQGNDEIDIDLDDGFDYPEEPSEGLEASKVDMTELVAETDDLTVSESAELDELENEDLEDSGEDSEEEKARKAALRARRARLAARRAQERARRARVAEAAATESTAAHRRVEQEAEPRHRRPETGPELG